MRSGVAAACRANCRWSPPTSAAVGAGAPGPWAGVGGAAQRSRMTARWAWVSSGSRETGRSGSAMIPPSSVVNIPTRRRMLSGSRRLAS